MAPPEPCWARSAWASWPRCHLSTTPRAATPKTPPSSTLEPRLSAAQRARPCPCVHQARRGQGQLWETLRHLSPGISLYVFTQRAHYLSPPSRGLVTNGQGRSAKPGVGRHIPGLLSRCRTQDQPFHPTAVGWVQGQGRRPRRIKTDVFTRAGALNLARLSPSLASARPAGLGPPPEARRPTQTSFEVLTNTRVGGPREGGHDDQ